MTTITQASVDPMGKTRFSRVNSTALLARRMSCGSVLAGMAVAVVVQLVFSLIGTGIGMSTLAPLRINGSPDASTFGMGMAIWWALSSIVALFASGWVASHLAGVATIADGALVRKAADAAAKVSAQVALSAALALILGAIAAAAGSVTAHREVDRVDMARQPAI